MKALPIVTAATLLMTSGAAAAQSAPDARCILLSSAYMRQGTDENAKKLAEATLYFYLGRISGQPTAAQLKATFDQQAKTITDATAGGLMDGCVKEFKSKMMLLQSLSPPPPAASKKPDGR